MTLINKLFVGSIFILAVVACTPEIGSHQWCADLKATTPTDWTASQATDFAKHCLLK
jgi:hypothetical protein